MSDGDGWETIHEASTEHEAALVAGYLREHGVPVQVDDRIFHQEPVATGQLGTAAIEVPAKWAAKARELMANLPSLEADQEVAEDGGGDPAATDDG